MRKFQLSQKKVTSRLKLLIRPNLKSKHQKRSPLNKSNLLALTKWTLKAPQPLSSQQKKKPLSNLKPMRPKKPWRKRNPYRNSRFRKRSVPTTLN